MKRLRITVNGVSYDVEVEVLEDDGEELGAPAPQVAVRSTAPATATTLVAQAAAPAPAAAGASGMPSPLAGIVAEVKVKEGDTVKVNDVLFVIEAMKMNSNVSAPVAGTVRTVNVKPGDTVRQGQSLLEFN